MPSKLLNFAEYFEAVHGYRPFSWQTRLAKQILAKGKYPDVVDLPTGSGKTALLDIAFFAFVSCPETMPRRIMFCVDRQIIVDQVYARALAIQRKLEKAETDVLKLIKSKIISICGSSENVLLGVTPLKGGIPIDREWARHPDLPWVLATTVDQLGSRLLFRGYGVSDIMKPVHAGLAGNDCLVILDEAHISKPFAETLQSISREYHGECLPERKFHIVEMTATPSSARGQRFALNKDDMEGDAELRKRIQIPKSVRLAKTSASHKTSEGISSVVRQIADILEGPKVVGVVVNRVATARATHHALQESGYSSHLITGRMRPMDRQVVLEEIEHLVSAANKDTSELEDPVFVVCTQAVEVGADYDFDAMITECAPVDNLKQRLGRLDRRGRYYRKHKEPSVCWIVGVAQDITDKMPDFVYGESLKQTWKYLESLKQTDGSLPLLESSCNVFENAPKECFAPKREAPLLLPSYMEAWCQTSPQPPVSPDIDPFLHGKEVRASCDVQIVWREDLGEQTLKTVPPRPSEYLTVPIYAAKAWLAGSAEIAISDGAFIVDEDSADNPSVADIVSVVRWQGNRKKVQEISTTESINPGDILLVHTSRGGISDHNWDPSSEKKVSDLGDFAQDSYGQKRTLRLDSEIYDWAQPLPDANSDRTAEAHIMESLETLKREENRNLPEAAIAQKLGSKSAHVIVEASSGRRYAVLCEKGKTDPGILDGTDETMSQTGAGTELTAHMDGVGAIVKEFAKRLGFPKKLSDDMELAGRLHDLGKADSRFQEMLAGCDPVALADMRKNNLILAKSPPDAPTNPKHNYPKGMRHEVASAAMVISASEIQSKANDIDLVLYLILTHHGRGRPWLPVIEDPHPQDICYEWEKHKMKTNSNLLGDSIAVDQAARFWRLSQKYGHYGIAWLEAVFRLADHKRSYLEGTGNV